MPETIAISGASGHIGGRVAHLLAPSGVRLRLLGRNVDHIAAIDGATTATIDFRDPASVGVALDGVQTFFFVSATESADRAAQQTAVVNAAKDAGVQRIVYLSFVGAAPDATFTFGRDHWYTEQAIRASGLAFTFLRDNQYQDIIPHFADADGVIEGPAADGRVAAVTRADVADCAAAVLDSTDHLGETFDLTGPRAFSLSTATAEMTEILGRPFRYVDQTVDEAYASRAKYDAPRWEVDGWVSTYTAIAEGELEHVTDAVPHLTGHPATDFRDFLATLPKNT
ncbi:SDR family oxidoreductase [Nocardia sp. PE-7]|uniref:SDR family oxidoreductase n=1 Tax=Nocardia sp. PE-7 TaxID=3058426 RepID=UPI00265A3B0B|nr:SDR family oxidoreductase [Nocardia sp. PE-7]WKG12532.1 SDR family oxidoreductase [Nocardia sp. PE-7]